MATHLVFHPRCLNAVPLSFQLSYELVLSSNSGCTCDFYAAFVEIHNSQSPVCIYPSLAQIARPKPLHAFVIISRIVRSFVYFSKVTPDRTATFSILEFVHDWPRHASEILSFTERALCANRGHCSFGHSITVLWEVRGGFAYFHYSMKQFPV